MKIVYVVAGVLVSKEGKILLAQRPANKALPFYWEFPGGKIEVNEGPCEALQRELREELGIEIDMGSTSPINFATQTDSEKHLTLLFFKVTKWQGEIKLLEEQPSFCWVFPEEAQELQMPPANQLLLPLLQGIRPY